MPHRSWSKSNVPWEEDAAESQLGDSIWEGYSIDVAPVSFVDQPAGLQWHLFMNQGDILQ